MKNHFNILVFMIKDNNIPFVRNHINMLFLIQKNKIFFECNILNHIKNKLYNTKLYSIK